ncbi:MAG: glutamate synthase subunit beta [bacterium]
MAKPTGFLEITRRTMSKRPAAERLRDWREIEQPLAEAALEQQGARCMDCGVPFCHLSGCPLRNLIPEWNDLVYRQHWREALELLHSTNNFPEITGRLCPALCEAACTLGTNDQPVTIRQIELQLVERGWHAGWIQPQPAAVRSGRKVAVVGSGPAGLAAAQQLARAGHQVTVYEAHDHLGGVLRYGIPDFKLEKLVIDRRLNQLRAEGVRFETGVRVGDDVSIAYLRRTYDAVLLAGGARIPRDLPIPGRDLAGLHFAMDYLIQQNQRGAGETVPEAEAITAEGRRVLIIGGGDTGADCLGTALRHGAVSVMQVEIMPQPPAERDVSTPWPLWPYMLRSSSSHEEGGERRWNLLTKEFIGKNGRVHAVRAVEVEWKKDANGRMNFVEKAGTIHDIPADLVLLAMGFTKEGNRKVLQVFGIQTTAAHDPVLDANLMSSVPGVFVAGDLNRGASLVVRAMMDGRQAAAGIDRYLCALAKRSGFSPA